MGLFRLLGKNLIYPIVRPAQQAKDSFGQIKADLEKLHQARAERKLRAEQDLKEHLEVVSRDDWEGFAPTEEQLRNPLLIKNPHQRFEVLYQANKWDEASLEEQLIAVRLSKMSAAYMSVAMFCFGFAMYFFMPLVFWMFTAPMVLTGAGVGFAIAIKHGLFQFQIESRKLLGVSEFLSKPDLIHYLFHKV